MMQADHYDTLVIGSGEGGKYLAWHMARQGRRTAVIERKLVGGSCPNTNCLPSKNEIWSAKVAHLSHHANEYGGVKSLDPVDMKRVLSRKKEMVDELIAIHHTNFQNSGAELIMGHATLSGPRAVSVALNSGGTRMLTAERLFLNLGTHAAIPDVPGLHAASPMTNIELLELDRLPSHLIVIGGGYIGLEMAQTFRRFGSAVTVVEAGPRLAPREDPDVSAALLNMMRGEGIIVHLSSVLERVIGHSGEAVTMMLRQSDGIVEVTGTDILVATGRTPNTRDIGLDRAGVERGANGVIVVNDRLETSAPGVWAIGECAGSPQFTHASMDDFRIIRDNLAGKLRTTQRRMMPYCMFTDPPLARIGLSATQATARGVSFRKAKIPTAAVLRSRTISETGGFLEALIGEDDRVLGFTMLGPDAGEVMSVVQVAMMAGLTYLDLRDAVLAHPTMAEGLNVLFSNVSVD
jgi:pyruvate/2-oxoglutarate dehydrogenase complex dihydrolipoamide dehydrogenase (E3) component